MLSKMSFILKNACATFCLIACVAGVAQADTISFLGTDPGDGSWRTTSVAKPLDPDGDNKYGTAGYDVFDSSAGTLVQTPAGVSITVNAGNLFPGDEGYTTIDNPSGGSMESGVAYYSPVTAGNTATYITLTFTAAENYVLGIYTDNADNADISPSSLRVYQANGTGDSGTISNTPSRTGDWYFFNISANNGDILHVDGLISAGFNSSGLGVITFDQATATPEPGTVSLLLAAGIAGLGLLRRKKG